MKRVRTHHLREMKQRGEKFTMLTAYEQYAAQTFDEAGIDVLLVGDSRQQQRLRQRDLAAGDRRRADPAGARRDAQRRAARWSSADLPFGSYQASPEQAYLTARPLHEGGGAHAVKLEGGLRDGAAGPQLLTEGGIPVMAHIGFTPQSEHALGGYRVQGRGDAAATGSSTTPRRSRRPARSPS